MLTAPVPPEKDDLLLVNATSATVFLEAWPNTGCPIINLDLAYRPQGQRDWSVLGSQMPPREEVVIADLSPARRYVLKVTARSDAGTTSQEYVFATRSKSGGETLVPVYCIVKLKIK